MTTRRDAFAFLGSAATFALLPVRSASAQTAGAQTGGVQDPSAGGPLGDVVLGPQDAKVTIIEYASLTCPHCAAFHTTTYPTLKERYIDAGKVRYVLREFPLDPLATAGFMLARWEPGKYYPVVDLLFARQRNWAFGDKPLDALRALMRQAGFSQEKFESCLRDQKLYDAVIAVRERGEKLGVNSTPTFFINGQRHPGNLSIDDLEKILKPLLDA
jgi:protein-disulfide isomerase